MVVEKWDKQTLQKTITEAQELVKACQQELVQRALREQKEKEAKEAAEKILRERDDKVEELKRLVNREALHLCGNAIDTEKLYDLIVNLKTDGFFD